MDSRTLVARNIRRLRVAAGLSQEGLALEANIDRSYMSRLERGIENPTLGILDKIAKALTVPIADLFVASGAKAVVLNLRGGRKPKKGQATRKS
jgi:transcriptional regulator with XRE-family HTH domain